MWWKLDEEINAVARARIRDFERYLKRVHDENNRRARRSTGAPDRESARRPPLWDSDPSFDPYHVRSRRRSIAYSIERAMKQGRYIPHAPAAIPLPKNDGESRVISAFPLADEVVSGRLYRSLLKKNRGRLSAHAYAYRDDLNLYDAVAYIKSEFYGRQRLFVAEYDFSDYFGTIAHDFLWETMRDIGFTMTDLERKVLEAFLTAPLPTPSGRGPTVPRTVGIPQGTSISLLLANIAATPLDRRLERLGVGFARYADDTLVWSRDYDSICKAAQALHDAANEIGSSINEAKSHGVRLLVSPRVERAEIASTRSVEYLSHSIRLDATTIKPDVLATIQHRITDTLFNNLLREPLAGTQDVNRLGRIDRDYATLIWEMRRLLYGRLSEAQVRRLLNGPLPPQVLRGVLSSFPLIDDDAGLQELDSWICTQTWLTLRKRVQLLRASSWMLLNPQPWDFERAQLIDFRSVSSRTGQTVDLRIPSAVRMSAVIRRAVEAHGTGIVGWRTAASLYGRR